MPQTPLFDWTGLDFASPLVDREGIRKLLPQRFEMEMLTAIVHLDRENLQIAGYKDVGHDEFWARGHMPGYPLLPGVLMCEAAAQLTCYLASWAELVHGDFLAFGGLENVRFRGAVYPGQRLVLLGQITRHRRNLVQAKTQGFVNEAPVFEGEIIGVPFYREASRVSAGE